MELLSRRRGIRADRHLRSFRVQAAAGAAVDRQRVRSAGVPVRRRHRNRHRGHRHGRVGRVDVADMGDIPGPPVEDLVDRRRVRADRHRGPGVVGAAAGAVHDRQIVARRRKDEVPVVVHIGDVGALAADKPLAPDRPGFRVCVPKRQEFPHGRLGLWVARDRQAVHQADGPRREPPVVRADLHEVQARLCFRFGRIEQGVRLVEDRVGAVEDRRQIDVVIRRDTAGPF